MTYGSVCSGIEAATMAWHPLGWTPAWFSEIEPFPCRVLHHHYPHVPNLGDMLKLRFNETFQKSTIDLLVGGTPCQSFSIAGLRGGLSDSRGNLALEFCRILTDKRPRWFVWENVPGVFSSGGGSDFANILQGFRECGYSVSWRVLDAQFFGVPQRRRRVFVVGYLGDDWRPSAAVLFEPRSMRGDIEKSAEKRQDVAGTLDARTNGGGFPGSDGAMNGHIVMATGQPNAERGRDLAPSLNCDHEQPILFSIMPMNGGKDYKARESQITQPLTTKSSYIGNQGGDILISPPSVFQYKQSSQESMNPAGVAPTLHKGKNPEVFHSSVRRLTPLECERLQGFPDGYTNIPIHTRRGVPKMYKDSPRYSAIGNSMPVPVMRWIGDRIDIIDKIFTK